MQLKITWMPYLIIGISISLTLLVNSCKNRVDYTVKSKWIYINETEHFISYSHDTLNYVEFNIKPFSTKIYEEIGDGDKNTTVESFISPLRPYIIFYGKFLCDTLTFGPGIREGEGPAGMSNYTSTKLGKNDFEFTYRFTNKDVEKADTCK